MAKPRVSVGGNNPGHESQGVRFGADHQSGLCHSFGRPGHVSEVADSTFPQRGMTGPESAGRGLLLGACLWVSAVFLLGLPQTSREERVELGTPLGKGASPGLQCDSGDCPWPTGNTFHKIPS